MFTEPEFKHLIAHEQSLVDLIVAEYKQLSIKRSSSVCKEDELSRYVIMPCFNFKIVEHLGIEDTALFEVKATNSGYTSRLKASPMLIEANKEFAERVMLQAKRLIERQIAKELGLNVLLAELDGKGTQS